MQDDEVFEAHNFALQKGSALPVARLACKTLGTLSPARDNVVLSPSWYSGTHREADRDFTDAGLRLARGS